MAGRSRPRYAELSGMRIRRVALVLLLTMGSLASAGAHATLPDAAYCSLGPYLQGGPSECPTAVVGTVRDAATGLAISRATVSDGRGSVTTALDGSYRLEMRFFGTYYVTATKSGYRSATKTITLTPVNLITNQPEHADFNLVSLVE